VGIAFLMLIVTVPVTSVIMSRALANLGEATALILRAG